jgi:hypothetical protein
MDNELSSSEIIDPCSPISTLIKALKTTIQLNDTVKNKLLQPENNFNKYQTQIIFENINILDDNTLILSQAVQAIRTLLSEIRNLKEIKSFDNSYPEFMDTNKNKFTNCNNSNIYYRIDTDFNNRYNVINSKSDEEFKLMECSMKTNVSKKNKESPLKLNFDYFDYPENQIKSEKSNLKDMKIKDMNNISNNSDLGNKNISQGKFIEDQKNNEFNPQIKNETAKIENVEKDNNSKSKY